MSIVYVCMLCTNIRMYDLTFVVAVTMASDNEPFIVCPLVTRY